MRTSRSWNYGNHIAVAPYTVTPDDEEMLRLAEISHRVAESPQSSGVREVRLEE